MEIVKMRAMSKKTTEVQCQLKKMESKSISEMKKTAHIVFSLLFSAYCFQLIVFSLGLEKGTCTKILQTIS